MSQEVISQKEKENLVPGFGERFLKAFDNLRQTEIATLLKVAPSAVTNYTKDRIPKASILLKVWEFTKCDLHWLLTGERFQPANRLLTPSTPSTVPLEADERRAVEQLAQTNKQTFDHTIRELIIEALNARGLMKPKPAPAMLLFRQDVKLVAIPLIGSISAGQPITYFKEQKEVLVADVFLPHNGYQSFVLEIAGDDWTDEGFSKGDYLICCDNKQPQNGQVVVAVIDGEQTTVKRYFNEAGQIRLQPTNGSGPGDLLSPERVSIVCTVTGVQKNA